MLQSCGARQPIMTEDMQQWLEDYGLISVRALRASFPAAIDMEAGEVAAGEGAHAVVAPEMVVSGGRKKSKTTRISSRGQYFARPGVARSTRGFKAALASFDAQ
jgi:hypothetical protein